MSNIFSAFSGPQKVGSKVTGPKVNRPAIGHYYGHEPEYSTSDPNKAPLIITNYMKYVTDPRKGIYNVNNSASAAAAANNTDENNTDENNTNENKQPLRKPLSYERETGILNARNLRTQKMMSEFQPETYVWNYRNGAGTKFVEDYFQQYSQNENVKGETFRDENIFLLDGHASDSSLNIESSRYMLKDGQYALIPGRCGVILFANYNITKHFFEYNKPIELFNKETKDNFSILEFSKVGTNQVTGITTRKNSTYKHYRPKLSNTDKYETISVPPLNIIPFNFLLNPKKTSFNEEILINIGGILQKSEPYHFEKKNSANNNLKDADKYHKSIYIEKEELEIPFQQFLDSNKMSTIKHAINTFKESLAKSVLTYENVIDLIIVKKHLGLDGDILGKMKTIKENPEYKSWLDNLTLNDIISLSLPVEFFFNFLNTRASKPYLLIFNVCRSVGDDFSSENLRRQRALSQAGGRRRRRTQRKKKRKVSTRKRQVGH